MKCVILSDSHNQHRDIELPAGDILIHCGDFTMGGKENEITDFLKWLGEIEKNYQKVFIVPGNHDGAISSYRLIYEDLLKAHTKNTVDLWLETYRKNQVYMFDGYSFFGFPYVPFHRTVNDFFVEEDKHEELVNNILDCNILVSHGPPLGYLDVGGHYNKSLGSFALKEKVLNMSDLKLMAFGHIHEQGGKEYKYKDTLLVNAALLDYPAYDMVSKPMVIDIND